MASPVTRHMTIEERYERALTKAKVLRLHAFQVSETLYKVRSQRAGHPAHFIGVTPRGLLCDCTAALAGDPCVHAATVAIRLQREHNPAVLSEWFETSDELFEGEDVTPTEPTPIAPTKPRRSLESMFDSAPGYVREKAS